MVIERDSMVINHHRELMVNLWWLNGDFMVMESDSNGDFMVIERGILWWLNVILWWFNGI